jgi:hypothetical protein
MLARLLMSLVLISVLLLVLHYDFIHLIILIIMMMDFSPIGLAALDSLLSSFHLLVDSSIL